MSRVNKKRRKKLKVKLLLKILLVIAILFCSIQYLFNVRTKNIYVKGNTLTKDIEIIKAAKLENYPKLIKIRPKKAASEITNLPLIKSAKIKRSIFGKVTITVEERNVLFYYRYNDKLVTSDNTQIDDNNLYLGYPTLINFTPDTTLEALVKGLNKVDPNIIKMIDEIEYEPYKSADGEIIDENRFKLFMNDANTIYIDTANIKRLNQYLEIYASLDMETVKGVLYLDTITEENILFESYQSVAETQEQLAKREEEKKDQNNEQEEKPRNTTINADNGRTESGDN